MLTQNNDTIKKLKPFGRRNKSSLNKPRLAFKAKNQQKQYVKSSAKIIWIDKDYNSVKEALKGLQEAFALVTSKSACDIARSTTIKNNICHDTLTIEQQVSNTQYSSKYRRQEEKKINESVSSLSSSSREWLASLYPQFKNVIDYNASFGNSFEKAQAMLILQAVKEQERGNIGA